MVKGMKNGKAAMKNEIPAEMWKAMGRRGADFFSEKVNAVMERGSMPKKWRESVTVPTCKAERDT